MVDHDLFLVIGLALLGLSVISLLSALVEDRKPVIAGVTLALGIGLSVWGAIGREGSLNPADLPALFFDVLGRYLP